MSGKYIPARVAQPLPLPYVEVNAVGNVKQCGILFVGRCGTDQGRVAALRSLGFRVAESEHLPSTEELDGYHAIVVRGGNDLSLPMVGARVRAKPLFGRRVLIALVPAGVSERDNREARMSGFDETLPASCTARDIAAQVLRLLRGYPEYRCLLRAPNGRRKAA
jgi:hypothetical protein